MTTDERIKVKILKATLDNSKLNYAKDALDYINILEKQLNIGFVNPSLKLAHNDEIRYAFESTENVCKPYGTTDGYINTIRAELRLNQLEIYVSNDG